MVSLTGALRGFRTGPKVEPNPHSANDLGSVALDGQSYLTCPALSATTSRYLSVSIWASFAPGTLASTYLYDFDPVNIQINFTVYPTQMIVSASPDGNNNLQWTTPNALPADDVRHHFLIALDTQAKTAQLFVDDQPMVLSLLNDLDPFDMAFSGCPVAIPDSPAYEWNVPLTGSMAEVWIAPAQYLDFTVVENRRKFITADLTPVNLGPHGQLPTGVSPAIYFSGYKANFATNQGSGGAFTVVGTLADGLPLLR